MTVSIKKDSVRNRDAIYKALDSVFSVAVLPFAIYALFTRGTDNPVKDRLYCAAFFFAFSLSFICQALRRKNHSDKYLWQLIQAGVCLVSVILILAVPNSDVSLPVITIMFALNLIHIVGLSFSGMDMKILAKVIRKTYAADVLSGLVLFMAAFSFMFPVVEKNIASLKDALWYCFAIVTTIGFGDYAATSTLGRVMSAILGAYGIVVVALITSVVVNFYSEVKKQPDDDEDL